VRNWR